MLGRRRHKLLQICIEERRELIDESGALLVELGARRRLLLAACPFPGK